MAIDFTQLDIAVALARAQRPGAPAIEEQGPAEEPGAPDPPPPAPLGEEVLGCRELVRQFFGRRVKMFTRYTRINPAANTATQLLKTDPRRIRYEITISSTNAATQQGLLGPLAVIQAGNAQAWELSITLLTFQVERDYLTDGDAVVEEIWAQSNNAAMIFSARETLLTPLPVDES